ncbi:MAG: NADH-quinone oxidoreductase subunit C [Planctomycetota bacterium]|jgi:NADH-quinone oxidoreductase subunit C|nr:NADH-quinone oxidoreductase subunit C [Planctomycetota bacterium]MDP6839930.1 NADH-quinone oxidoreductase subunit C [Planctomycetota bacterium]MDP6957000.1 NADH-quinone oxidoreductase subunit C [Planctomycetota bacterium]
MDFQALYAHLQAQGAAGLGGCDEPRAKDPEDKQDKGRAGDPFVLVAVEQLPAFLQLCRDDEALGFEVLIDLSAVDPAAEDEDLWLVIQLLSLRHRHRLMIKSMVPKATPCAPTVAPVYRAAQWHERECAEMFGITFEGHSDPRHILLPEDWVGYPLRKDYVFPKEYRGVSCE